MSDVKMASCIRRKGKRGLPSRAPVQLETQFAVNKCRSTDFMNDSLMSGQRFRTFNVLDDFNREVLAIENDTNLPATRVVRILDRIAAWRGYPAKMRLGKVQNWCLSGWRDGLNNRSGVGVY